MNTGLSKRERLCSVTAIEQLIAKGRYAVVSPIRACFYIRPKGDTAETDELDRIAVSVPKKLFKRAVKRNLLKRRIREAYRLQKEALEVHGIDIMFIYNLKEVADFKQIYDAVGKIIEKINRQ